MSATILVTGFEPFGGMATNPTEQLVTGLRGRSVPGVELRTAVLPVRYDDCLRVILDEIERVEPDAVIACGLAAGRTAVTPERVAINVKHTGGDEAIPDNSGRRPVDEPISDGPDGLFSTLPIREIERVLIGSGIPAAISNTAGTYICNNTMYGVLDHLRREGGDTLAGFIHFPASTEMAASDPRLPSLPLAVMERALVVAIETVAEYLPTRADSRKDSAAL
ncbi:MAG TPA: pyroglutamyl-peptidase I [Nocardioidaceae bacterium]|nr:pyroglutamyl-peptidase I [Nocardioidaceae bacterium]